MIFRSFFQKENMNQWSQQNMSSTNRSTMYQNIIKQSPASDLQTTSSDIRAPEFTQTAYKGGEDLTVTNMYKSIVNTDPTVQTVYNSKVKDAVAELNTKGYYNGITLDQSKNSMLKDNQQIYNKSYGGTTAVNNNVIPKQDQTIGGSNARVLTQQNINQVGVQQAIKTFEPQYNDALNRQATEQKGIDQTKAIEEHNPGIAYERHMIANQLNTYDQINRYNNYMNTENVPAGDSRYHKLNDGAMIKINAVQTPGVYLNQPGQNYRPQNNQIVNQQTTQMQKPNVLNRQVLDQQQINLFHPVRNNYIDQNSNIQSTTTTQSLNKQQINYRPQQNEYIQQQLTPQVGGRTLQQTNNQNILFRPYEQGNVYAGGMVQNDSLLFGGPEQDIFNADFLFNR